MKSFLSQRVIRKEISLLQWSIMLTGKLLIGIGLGLIIATHAWFMQPYWMLLIITGLAILVPTVSRLMTDEIAAETQLETKIKKPSRKR